jgi:hypothetical protein
MMWHYRDGTRDSQFFVSLLKSNLGMFLFSFLTLAILMSSLTIPLVFLWEL